jgi:hypothetical protein
MSTMTKEAIRKSKNQLNHQFREQLRSVGFNDMDMLRGETFHLSTILLSNENIIAGVFGRNKGGSSVLMLITDHRIISISQIPLFTDTDDFAYSAVNGVSLDTGWLSSTIKIYTTSGDSIIQTRNKEAATYFVNLLEHMAIENLSSSRTQKHVYAHF